MDIDERSIHITNFVNPYQFWYFCTADENSYTKVRDNEEALTKFFKDNYNGTSRAFQPDIGIGKKIAVRYLPRNIYMRVRIEEIVRKRHATSYIVWALDHGFPFETKEEYCRRLPEKFDVELGRIRYGGIERVVPAEKEYDFIEQQTVTVIKERWSTRACYSLERIISDAASVEFIERFKENEKYWGDLIIRSHRGKAQHASDFLINENVAVHNFGRFKELCSKIKIPVWQTNDGNNKYTENVVSSVYDFSTDQPKYNPNDSFVQNAITKVAAWSDFNKRAVENVGKAESFIENLDSASTCYDTDIDDSVSKVAERIDKGIKELNLNGGGGIQQKANKKLPPAPTLADFGLPEDVFGGATSVAEDENSSIVTLQSQKSGSSRSQHLLEMRAKSKQKHAKKQVSEVYDAANESTNNLNRQVEDYNAAPESSVDFGTNFNFSGLKQKSLFGESDKSSQVSMSSSRTEHLNLLRKKSEEMRAKRKDELERTKVAKNSQNQVNMLPAGFDLANLNTYNKKDHWHRKETTRYEHHPHDISVSSESDNQNQDFRFTRANTDKYKKPQIDIHNDNIKESSLPLNSINPQRYVPKVSERNNNCNFLDAVDNDQSFSSLSSNSIKSRRDFVKSNASNNNSKFLDAVNNDDDNDDNISNSSSQISMYSAVSSLEKIGLSATTFQAPVASTGNTKHSHVTNNSSDSNELNNSSDLLENFIIKADNIAKVQLNRIQVPAKNSTVQDKVLQEKSCILMGDVKFRMKYLEHTVLAHSQLPLNTTESLNKTYLSSYVRRGMEKRGITHVYRTQTYAWPHLVQGNSVFIVNRPDSGKTWSFIPALCTAIINCLENQLVPVTYGPLAIIIVASAKRVTEVTNDCAYLLHKLERQDAKIVGSYGIRDLTNTKILLMETCAVLVVTPPNLQRLLKSNEKNDPLFDPLRLQHIIIDDIDVMLTRCKDDITTVFKTLYAFVPKKSKKLFPQLVVTSRFYLPIFEKLIQISNQPLLIIADFLEAAVYGKANISIELCSKAQKLQRIFNFIKAHPIKDESLMILCSNDDDVFFVSEALKRAGIDFLGYHSQASIMIRDQFYRWKNEVNLRSQVLVCSDSVLAELEIQNVQNLIHYSLADSWTKLKQRFSVHIKMYENLVVSGFDTLKLPEQRVTSLILLDEENNMELPRVVEFLKYHNQLKYLHPDIVMLSKRITMQREIERRTVNNQICNLLFEYGDCDEQACLKRHVLTKEDLDNSDSSEPLLQSGDLRMLILNVLSPTHYSVRLLEHRATSTSNWRIIRQSDRAALFSMNFNFFYSQPNNLKQHWPINENDICVFERKETFHRARVLKVENLTSHNVIKTLEVTIKLLDSGNILCEKSDKLYVCHEKFRNFPAQAIDVRLIGVLPLDNERYWDADVTRHVKGLLIDNLRKNDCVHANINCSLVDTIFVREIVVMEKLPTLENYIYRIHLKHHLVENKYGVIDMHAEERILDIIKKHGLEEILKKIKEEENKLNIKQEKIDQHKQKQNTKIPLNLENMPQIALLNENDTKANKINKNNVSDSSITTKNNITRTEFLKNLKKKKIIQKKSVTTINKIIEKTPTTSQELKTQTPLPPLCSVLEFLQAVQLENYYAAEDCNINDEEVPEEVRKYFRETALLCQKAITQELEKQDSGNKPTQQQQKALMEAPKIENSYKIPKTKANFFEYQQPLKLEINKIQKDHISMQPPRLKDLHMRPETLWYETNHLIILCIKAPDILDYYLEVAATYLYFMAKINGVEHVLVLNFLGTIKPQYVTHELRGLNVIIRLVKSIFIRWPRLLKQEEKMSWLNYNLNMLNVEEIEKLLPLQFLERVLHTTEKSKNNVHYSDDDDESNDDNFQTFTEIKNSEDIHDPMSEMFSI